MKRHLSYPGLEGRSGDGGWEWESWGMEVYGPDSTKGPQHAGVLASWQQNQH